MKSSVKLVECNVNVITKKGKTLVIVNHRSGIYTGVDKSKFDATCIALRNLQEEITN
jgi:hypothetical protein